MLGAVYVEQGLAQGGEQGREQGLRNATLEFARARLDELPFGYEQIRAGFTMKRR